MKIRGSRAGEKIEAQMAPMIDVVFQLLIFFMLTLKIVEPEGDFSVNMPIGQTETESSEIPQVINITMTSNPTTGWMESLKIGGKELFAGTSIPAGIDPEEAQLLRAEHAFQALNNEILNLIGAPGSPQSEDQEVEIDGDYELNARYVINAIGSCRGAIRRDSQGRTEMVDYIKNIKFAPPHEPRN